MAVFSGSPLYRVYAQPQATYGTVPNSTGTWTNTGAKLIPHARLDLKALEDLIEANWKTGTAAMLTGTKGQAGASFSLEAPLMPSGAAGTAPNLDPVLKAIFGTAATVVSSTSVTYNMLSGASVPLILAKFNEAGGSTNTSQFGHGFCPQNFTFNIGGGGYIVLTCDGPGMAVLDSDYFSSEDASGAAGLTSFPSEPGTPTLTGNQLHAYTDTATFGGSSAVEFISAQISGNTGRSLVRGSGRYAVGIAQGRRSVALNSLKFLDSDGSTLQTIKQAAKSKSALDVVITQGATAGYIVTHTLKSVQFGNASFSENGAQVEVNFDNSPAHASSLTGENDYKIALT